MDFKEYKIEKKQPQVNVGAIILLAIAGCMLLVAFKLCAYLDYCIMMGI